MVNPESGENGMRFLVTLALAALALGSFASLLSPVYWAFDLINHFRPQILAISTLFLILTLLFRVRVGFAVLILAGNAVLFAYPLVMGLAPSNVEATEGRVLRLLVANVNTANRAHDRVLALVRMHDPDIVLLTEVNSRWTQALRPLEVDYPHTLPHPQPDNFGLAVYAKAPFRGGIIEAGEPGLPLAVLQFEGFTLANAHPFPPISQRAHSQNTGYLAELAAEVSARPGPAIVAGDLNTTLWGDAITPLREAGLRTANADLLAYTWPSGRPIFAMQIDHVLVRGLATTAFEVMPDIGSDHFPILVDVILP